MNIIFDIGGVLIDFSFLPLYEDRFDDKSELDWFLANVMKKEYWIPTDAGKSIADAAAPSLRKQKRSESLKKLALRGIAPALAASKTVDTTAAATAVTTALVAGAISILTGIPGNTRATMANSFPTGGLFRIAGYEALLFGSTGIGYAAILISSGALGSGSTDLPIGDPVTDTVTPATLPRPYSVEYGGIGTLCHWPTGMMMFSPVGIGTVLLSDDGSNVNMPNDPGGSTTRTIAVYG